MNAPKEKSKFEDMLAEFLNPAPKTYEAQEDLIGGTGPSLTPFEEIQVAKSSGDALFLHFV